MIRITLCSLCVFCLAILNTTFGQAKKILDVSAEQRKYEKEIMTFLKAKLASNSSVTDEVISDLQSSKSIAVQPMGLVFDSSYMGPDLQPGNVDIKTLRKDSVYFISFETDPSSQKAVSYNNGQTLIYNYRVNVTVYAYGNLVSFNVTRLETYIKHKNKWLMVAGSGTEYKPNWSPTPAGK